MTTKELPNFRIQYVDLDLPSGTLWASENTDDYVTHQVAIETFGDKLPSKEDFIELVENTWHGWDKEKKGMWFINKKDLNKKIFLPAVGYRCDTSVYYAGSCGFYWSSSYDDSNDAYYLHFDSSNLNPANNYYRDCGRSVRLVKR